MSIRFYSPEHLHTVTDLLLDMSIHYNGSNASTRDEIRRNLVGNLLGPHSGVRLVVALDEGRAVGLAAISILYPAPKERGQLFMKELYVVADSRGKGVGTALMQFVARHAVAMSCSRFDWTVGESNADALRFYHRLGAQTEAGKLYFRLTGAELERLASAEVIPPKVTGTPPDVVYSFSESQLRDLHALYQDEWWTKGRTLEETRRCVEGSQVCLGLADTAGKLIGFSRVLTDFTFKALIFDLIDAPAHREAGLGDRLVSLVTGHEKLRAVKSFELYCLPELVPYYERHGFSDKVGGIRLMRRTETSTC